MDRNTKYFIIYSCMLLGAAACALAVLGFVYRNFTLDTYNIILFYLILFISVIIIFFALLTVSILFAKRKGNAPGIIKLPLRLGLKVLLPVTAAAAGLFMGSRDSIRRLYIDINNIIVESGAVTFRHDQILILLPHCLQNSGCSYKITTDIKNCRQCGRCVIGSILRLSLHKGVQAVVATGGTAARNIVRKTRPDIILSVACERDLTSGIADVGNIPVIGILNERPEGPCFNTTVNMDRLSEKLDMLLGVKTKDRTDLDRRANELRN